MLISFGTTVHSNSVMKLKISKLKLDVLSLVPRKLLKMSERRDLHKLSLLFKKNLGLSPLYLSNVLPSHVVEVSFYRLRNAINYTTAHLFVLVEFALKTH